MTLAQLQSAITTAIKSNTVKSITGNSLQAQLLNIVTYFSTTASGTFGSVTQATDITTGITSNNDRGVISLQSISLTTNTSTSFTFTNSKILTTSGVLLTPMIPNGSGRRPIFNYEIPTNGTTVITIYNPTSSTATISGAQLTFQILN